MRGIAPGPANVIYAMEESLGDSKHERCFYSLHGSAATFDVRDVIKVAADPTAVAELRALVLRIKGMRSDKSDVLGVSERGSFSEPDLLIAENDVVEKGGQRLLVIPAKGIAASSPLAGSAVPCSRPISVR